jgi:hypothetical protein
MFRIPQKPGQNKRESLAIREGDSTKNRWGQAPPVR